MLQPISPHPRHAAAAGPQRGRCRASFGSVLSGCGAGGAAGALLAVLVLLLPLWVSPVLSRRCWRKGWGRSVEEGLLFEPERRLEPVVVHYGVLGGTRSSGRWRAAAAAALLGCPRWALFRGKTWKVVFRATGTRAGKRRHPLCPLRLRGAQWRERETGRPSRRTAPRLAAPLLGRADFLCCSRAARGVGGLGERVWEEGVERCRVQASQL